MEAAADFFAGWAASARLRRSSCWRRVRTVPPTNARWKRHRFPSPPLATRKSWQRPKSFVNQMRASPPPVQKFSPASRSMAASSVVMTAAQVVKNTWMAQDATLASGPEANRRGICFVYDLKGVGLKNVTFDPMALRDVIRGALSHPCHISRVWLLDAPRIFLLSWHAFKHFVPADVRKLVRFANTRGRRGTSNFSEICPPSELPVYLGGGIRISSQKHIVIGCFSSLKGRSWPIGHVSFSCQCHCAEILGGLLGPLAALVSASFCDACLA